MKTTLFSVIFIILFAIPVKAETYCQNVNRTGYVQNAAPLATTMSRWLRQKGSDYQTSSNEITNTVKNYCKSNPYGTSDDITNHLSAIVNTIAGLK